MNFFISYDRIRKKLYIQKILFTIFLTYFNNIQSPKNQ